jgi:hypothetical protein
MASARWSDGLHFGRPGRCHSGALRHRGRHSRRNLYRARLSIRLSAELNARIRHCVPLSPVHKSPSAALRGSTCSPKRPPPSSLASDYIGDGLRRCRAARVGLLSPRGVRGGDASRTPPTVLERRAFAVSWLGAGG